MFAIFYVNKKLIGDYVLFKISQTYKIINI